MENPSGCSKGCSFWKVWHPWAQLGQTASAPNSSISQVGKEASRSFTQGQHPPFPQPGEERGFQELPGAWLSRAPPYPPARGRTGLGPSGGAGHGFCCSAPSPWITGSKPPASNSAGLRVNSEQLHSSQSFPLMRVESLRMSQLFVLWESRANAERRLGGASRSLNNESQPLPAAHFFAPIPSPC